MGSSYFLGQTITHLTSLKSFAFYDFNFPRTDLNSVKKIHMEMQTLMMFSSTKWQFSYLLRHKNIFLFL